MSATKFKPGDKVLVPAVVACVAGNSRVFVDVNPNSHAPTDVIPADALDTLRAERDAYERAKSENDERFMLERDAALAEVERMRNEVREKLYELPWWKVPGDRHDEARAAFKTIEAERDAATAEATALRGEVARLTREFEEGEKNARRVSSR